MWVFIVVSMTYPIAVPSLPLGSDFRCALLVCLVGMAALDLVILLVRLIWFAVCRWFAVVFGWRWAVLFWANL